MKKFFILLSLSLSSIVAMADILKVEYDGIYYEVDTEAKTASVVSDTAKYFGDVEIPSIILAPDSCFVTSIGDWALYGCSRLTSITIPNSITNIGNGAFYACCGLTSVTCLAINPPTLGTYVFDSISCNNIPLYVHESRVAAYQAAEQWNEFDIQPFLVEIDSSTPATTQIVWLPVDSASMYNLRLYSEPILLDTTLHIAADSLNGGISVPMSSVSQRVRRIVLDDIGSVVVITIEPNSGKSITTPYIVTVSTTSKEVIDVHFDMEVMKGNKQLREEDGLFTLNADMRTSIDDNYMSVVVVPNGCYDLYGRNYSFSQWNSLPAGIYILREGNKSTKIRKR